MDKEVILITGSQSDWFLEAVFVVKDKKKLPKNLLVEAEKIIEGYLYKKGLGTKPYLEPNKLYKKPDESNKMTKSTAIKPQKGYSVLEKLFVYTLLIGLCVLMGFLLRGII